MSPKSVTVLALLAIIVAVTVADGKKSKGDFKAKATRIINKIRRFAVKAKNGMKLSDISDKARALEGRAAKLLEKLPDGATGCETELVIKLAAARTGSHEVLTLLQAGDYLGVLNGRLALSLAFLESVAQLMEDELTLSVEIGGHLTALIYGANMTDNIVQNTDAVLSEAETVSESDDTSEPVSRPTRSWGLSGDGVTWTTSSGRTSIGVKPTFSNGGGATATFRYRF